MTVQWPSEHSFALSICDDTDFGTVDNLRPVYDALHLAGLRTTKTVWSLPCTPEADIQGQTLADDQYTRWVGSLADKGFEIAWHGARSGGAIRADVEHGLQTFYDILGFWPDTYANHSTNIENIYWGTERFDNPLLRFLYGKMVPHHSVFLGTAPNSDYFWGDLCLKRLKYVRDFTFTQIATTRVDTCTPYHDPRRPYVRSWFSSSDGADADKFVKLLSPKRLDYLERSGNACIVYTHFACGFLTNGKLRADVQDVFADLARRNGWYVPVRELLRFLEERRGLQTISRLQRFELEARWSLEHLGQAIERVAHRPALASLILGC